MTKHAQLAPSGATKWIACPAAPAAEAAIGEDDLNIYAAEGTAAHFLASESLEYHDGIARENLGVIIFINIDGEAQWKEPEEPYAFKFPIDSGMVGYVQKYLDDLKDFAGEEGIIFPEVRVDISPITGEVDAEGTSDAIVIRDREIQIHDLKYGMKPVEAYCNKQLAIYAKGAIEEYKQLGYEFDQVLFVIHQPRIGNGEPSTHAMDIAEFNELIASIKTAAAIALQVLEFSELGADSFEHATPGSHCHDNYCKARDTCPALQKEIVETSSAMDGFLQDLDNSPYDAITDADDFHKTLGDFALKVPMIEAYCKSIMARVSAEILNGAQVPGFKAVMGRQGNREWCEGYEDALATTKIKKELVYKQVALSPTELETSHKEGKISDSQWKKLSGFIIRSDAKVTIAPISDKRPPVEVKKQNTADDFETLG